MGQVIHVDFNQRKPADSLDNLIRDIALSREIADKYGFTNIEINPADDDSMLDE